MEKILIDTSVLVKFFAPDEKDKTIDFLLEKIVQKKLTLIVIDIALYEFVNALFLSKKLSSYAVYENLLAILDLEPVIIAFSPVLVKKSLEIMKQFGLTIYDSFSVTAAQRENIPLLTADYKHHKKNISKNILHYKHFKIYPA